MPCFRVVRLKSQHLELLKKPAVDGLVIGTDTTIWL